MTNLKALEIWTAQTLCDMGILLSIVSLLLHVGRPYFERLLARFPLRVAADVWWLTYVVLRDGSLFGATLIGFWNLNLDLMADIKVGLPFVPAGTVLLAVALVLKVFRNAEDMNRTYRTVTALVTGGAVLNTVGWVFVMEGPGPEYEAATTGFWRFMLSLRSNANPQLATVTFYVTLVLLALILAYAVIQAFRLLSRVQSAAARQSEAPDVQA